MAKELEALNVKQARTAWRILGDEIKFAKHVQSRVSLEYFGVVELFLYGRRVRTLTMGPRGGVRHDVTEPMQ